MTEIKRCTQCVLPDNFPGIQFNSEGLCNLCQTSSGVSAVIENRLRLKEKLESFLSNRKQATPYDCIVALSGGKDSSYTLKILKQDYDLKCLAVTIDNGFLSEQAQINCREVTDQLGVDFMEFKPSTRFMKNMYTKSLEKEGLHPKSAVTRASDVCNSCINLINNTMVKIALQNQTPIIAGGYIGGQVPKDAAMINYDISIHHKFREKKMDKLNETFGDEAAKYFDIPQALIGENSTIKIINPMLTIAISENQIIKEVSKVGWKKSHDTGLHSSNCRLNDLGIYHHYKKYGFHPYVAEISEQVRAGLMEREQAIKKLENLPTQSDIQPQADKLGVNSIVF